MKHRKSAITSPSEAVRIAQASEIAPPAHIELSDNALLHFAAIVKEKPKAEWSLHELDVAAFLARIMARYVSEAHKLRDEGAVTQGATGPRMNPRCRVVSMLSDQIIAYRRTLSIHGRAKHGEARDAARRNRIGRDGEANPGDELDGLIAKPH